MRRMLFMLGVTGRLVDAAPFPSHRFCHFENSCQEKLMQGLMTEK